MGAEEGNFSIDYVRATAVVERQMRNIFLGSMALSLLVLLNFAFLSRLGGTLFVIVRVSFPLVLVWSFCISGYAFHSLFGLAKERRCFLETSTLTDPKTGVKSLGYMRNLLKRECERAVEMGQSAAVVYVDLENLDLVNRDFGYAVGDIVLRGVAGSIETSVPAEAVVGRGGAGGFVVMLPATKLEKARSIAGVIKRTIQQYSLDLGEERRVDFLRCRIGVVGCPGAAGFADEIIRIARESASKERVSIRNTSDERQTEK